MQTYSVPQEPRPLPATNRKYCVQKIQDNHHEAIRMMLIGCNNMEIAEALGLSSQQVSNIRNSPVVRQQLDMLHDRADAEAVNVRKRIEDLMPAAVDTLESLMANSVDSIRVRVAEDVLGMGGISKVTRVEGNIHHDHMHLTGSDINQLKAAWKAEKAIMADATVENVEDQEDK